MDVVSLHQAGVSYAVATLGTATTPDHLQRIFRLVGEVVFCFDGDRAGRAAACARSRMRSRGQAGRQVRFLFCPRARSRHAGSGGRRCRVRGQLASALPSPTT